MDARKTPTHDQITGSPGDGLAHFRYAFLIAVAWAGGLVCMPFIVADWLGLNEIGHHVRTIQAYTVISVMVVGLTWRHPHRVRIASWIYAACTLAVHVSALLFVPADEMRAVWFVSLIIGTYVLLGVKAGGGMALLSGVAIVLANGHTTAPLSPKGLGTLLSSLVSIAIISHVLVRRLVKHDRRNRQLNEELRRHAQRDPLTGVYNLRAVREITAGLIRLAARRGEPCCVLFIDLDHFKRINDTHGHAAGDLVLKSVAEGLVARLRQSDVVGRIGGEEFVAYLPDTTQDNALALAEELRVAIERLCPRLPDGTVLRVTGSIGVACCKDSQQDFDTLQKQADTAMYQAKAAGRNRVTALM